MFFSAVLFLSEFKSILLDILFLLYLGQLSCSFRDLIFINHIWLQNGYCSANNLQNFNENYFSILFIFTVLE